MARYRVGNRFLSEEEYQKEQDTLWTIFLFIIGALFAGYFSNKGVAEFGLEKWLRFTIIIVSGILGGTALARLRVQIQILFYAAIFISALYLLGSLLWSLI